MLTFPHWFGRALKPSQRPSKRNVRRKLRLEELEGRHLLSAVAITSKAPRIDPPSPPAMVAVQNAPGAEKSGSPLAAGINVKRFNGTYAGKYVGWVDGEIESGTIRFTVSNGLVKVTSPGKGSGRIDAQGNVNFAITGKTSPNSRPRRPPATRTFSRWTWGTRAAGVPFR